MSALTLFARLPLAADDSITFLATVRWRGAEAVLAGTAYGRLFAVDSNRGVHEISRLESVAERAGLEPARV